ncbi:MAG: hypothetical protein SGPRY_013758 [Prymnesium sp.]
MLRARKKEQPRASFPWCFKRSAPPASPPPPSPSQPIASPPLGAGVISPSHKVASLSVPPPPRCPPQAAFDAWCEARLVDSELERAMLARGEEGRAIRAKGEGASPQELLAENLGVIRNAIELLLTSSDDAPEAKREAESAELIFARSLDEAKREAARNASRKGHPASVGRALGKLSEPVLPCGARAFWAELGRWRASRAEVLCAGVEREPIDASILAELATAIELPAAAAPTLVHYPLLVALLVCSPLTAMRDPNPLLSQIRARVLTERSDRACSCSEQLSLLGASNEIPPHFTSRSRPLDSPPSSPMPSPPQHSDEGKPAALRLLESLATPFTFDPSRLSNQSPSAERLSYKEAFLAASSPENWRASNRSRPASLLTKADPGKSESTPPCNSSAWSCQPGKEPLCPTPPTRQPDFAAKSWAKQVGNSPRAASSTPLSPKTFILASPPQHSTPIASSPQLGLTIRGVDRRLPFPWEEVETNEGKSFFYNPYTEEQRRTPPPTLLHEHSTLIFTSLLQRVCAPAPLATVSAGIASTYVVGSGGELLCFGRGEGGELGVDDAGTLEEEEDGEDCELFSALPRMPEGVC